MEQDSPEIQQNLQKEISEKAGSFKISKKIGSGGFGTVFKAMRLKDRKFVAVKKISMQNLNFYQQRKTLREALSHKSINHTNIVKYFCHNLRKI